MTSRLAIAVLLLNCAFCYASDKDPSPGADGYCLVSTVEDNVWIKGETNITSVYRGCRFHFLNGNAKAKFDKKPEFYAPMIDGNDPVLSADSDKRVPGKRGFAMRHKDRTFFFASRKNMEAFDANPDPYALHARNQQEIEDKLRRLELNRGKPASVKP
ncbi:YHS domain protein [Rubripirellula obstinata]|uniref:YHS domain protein n=1 Tax=Rubripirellula obstinata TaxID=406547 RepID=A0A5B1CCK5_9BACT|nr:YHS domain-containing protein [Rubripirellula obstinata]KAA1257133.1 YHS domain protein [Rubripirellula obstinata]